MHSTAPRYYNIQLFIGLTTRPLWYAGEARSADDVVVLLTTERVLIFCQRRKNVLWISAYESKLQTFTWSALVKQHMVVMMMMMMITRSPIAEQSIVMGVSVCLCVCACVCACVRVFVCPRSYLCAAIPVAGQRAHGTTFRALKVTSQVSSPGAESAVYDCLVC